MNRSLHIGTYAGIPVKIHWTFLFTVLLVIYIGIVNNLSVINTAKIGGFVGVLFLCVILHEYGHALMARRYGIVTRDIIISPIGGLARLEDLPERPLHEILIAIAGPLVNVLIATLLSITLIFVIGEPVLVDTVSEHFERPTDYLRAIIVINVILFLFNLIPAFPMDGGRILRALLSIKWGRARGTKMAAFVGRILAIGFIVYAVLNNQLTLGIIGVFIYTMAGMENRNVQLKQSLKGGVAHQIMRKEWTKVHLSDTMDKLIDIYLRGGERSFIVYDSLGYLVGCIPELFIKDAIQNEGGHLPVTDRLSNSLAYASPDTTTMQLYQTLSSGQAALILIKEAEQIVGVIDRSIIENFMASNQL